MIASLQFLLSIMLVMLLFCMAKVSCADFEAKIHDHVTGSERMEENSRPNLKQTKHQWTPHEDSKLVECLVELATTSWNVTMAHLNLVMKNI
ncbi:hypothetical protein Ahy_A03g013669 isoform B [Arachis hypogaea]|uniref:Myb-like domain-containing protein n=1 Tax=Arachis hypogaea TaxID=3818 RepID=A0A445DVW7_ARAHY|nr:hypothetical protein Ahy_A03g013669 isoform B [Arachis hypogaea]